MLDLYVADRLYKQQQLIKAITVSPMSKNISVAARQGVAKDIRADLHLGHIDFHVLGSSELKIVQAAVW